MVRQELASLLWGAGFLFLIAAAILAVRLCAAGFSGANKPGLSLRCGMGAFAPGAPVRFALEIDLPGWLLPLCRVSCAGRLESQDGRIWTWQVGLAGGPNRVEFGSCAPRRGAYSGPVGWLMIEDLFGFSRAVVRLSGTQELIVYPDLPAESPPGGTARNGGSLIARVEPPERNEELLETRRYVPGDDPRRIKWKLRAHSGELFVRIGEEEPPPGARLAVVVDPAFNARIIAPALRPIMLDRLAQAAAGIILDAHARGLQLELGEAGRPAFIVEQPAEAMVWLARLCGRPIAAGMAGTEESPDDAAAPAPGTLSGPARPNVLVRLPGNPRDGSADLIVLASPPVAGEFPGAQGGWGRGRVESRLAPVRVQLEEDLIRFRSAAGEARVTVC
jgi:hypothetical protein